jgi:hypothetical protein
MAKEQEQIARIMNGLKCTEAEAREIYLADCAIDKGEKMDFDISAEQEKVVKKMRQADRKPTVYKFDKRERKENAPKRQIIDGIYQFLLENPYFLPENVQILNKERQISFDFADEKFEITLTQKRKPKN